MKTSIQLEVGDKIRLMEPTKVPRGFIDCSTLLTVSRLRPLTAYWTTPAGKQIVVPIHGAYDVVT